MPSITSLLTIFAASAATLSSAAPVTVNKRDVPAGWASGYLEDYETYHVRYLALDCQDQHNTTFFDSCCHPLLANEDLSSRPSNCTPTAAESSSAVARIASATASSTAASATSTSTSDSYSTESEESDDSEDTDGEDDTDSEYCDEATSVAAEVSSAQASVQATATESVTVVTLTSAGSTQTVSVNNNYIAPTTTSSPTSTWEEATSTSTSTSTAAAETSSSSSSGSSGEVMTGGYATYFYQGGVAGECGTVHSDSDKVIAIDSNGWWSDYQSNDNSPYCGKYITITNTNNGKSVTAMVADVCPTCTTDNSLDLSVGAFTAIASESDGMVPITWVWA